MWYRYGWLFVIYDDEWQVCFFFHSRFFPVRCLIFFLYLKDFLLYYLWVFLFWFWLSFVIYDVVCAFIMSWFLSYTAPQVLLYTEQWKRNCVFFFGWCWFVCWEVWKVESGYTSVSNTYSRAPIPYIEIPNDEQGSVWMGNKMANCSK